MPGIEASAAVWKRARDALGTGDDQRPGSFVTYCASTEPSETAEMIAMQMGDADHAGIFVGREPEPIHANQRRDAAIDEKGGAVRLYVEGGLELSARAKSTPTPYDCKLHDRRTSPPLNFCLSTRRQAPRQSMAGVSAQGDGKRRIRDFPT